MEKNPLVIIKNWIKKIFRKERTIKPFYNNEEFHFVEDSPAGSKAKCMNPGIDYEVIE